MGRFWSTLACAVDECHTARQVFPKQHSPIPFPVTKYLWTRAVTGATVRRRTNSKRGKEVMMMMMMTSPQDIVTRALHAHTYTHRGREVRGRFSAVSFGLNTCYLSSCSALSASTNRNERKLDTMTARAWQLTTPHTAEVWRQLSSISLSLSLYSLAFDGYQRIWHSWNCVTLRIPKQSAKINWCDVKPLRKFK